MSDLNEKNTQDFDDEEINVDKVKRMIYKIYSLERSNTKTGKYGERDMKDQIKAIIEEEVGRCY